ncbi:MAG: beta-lactamase family protein [Acidobacteriota bacterium]|nr:beta-lactamase family protein [Acidobacteriota bacterium]
MALANWLTRCGTLLAFLALSVGASTVAAQSPLRDFRQQFDSQLTRHNIVGGAFAFVNSSRPPTEFLHGSMNTISRQAIDRETAYNWASITKTFTAIAILQLRDRGLLKLDDPVVHYVPEVSAVHDAYGSIGDITIRNLLTHSAGFRNPTWPWDCDDAKDCSWQPFEPTKWSQIVAMLPYTHVAFKPGSRWSYSNLGYVFLGQVIERLSGDDFEVYIDKNILKPLGMTESYFDRAPYFLESHVSSSYLRAGMTLTPQPFNFDTGITTSNSGLKAPITNMEKYLRFLIGEPGNSRYEMVLKRSSLQEAWKGEVPITESGETATAYTATAGQAQPMMGLGFFVLSTGTRTFIYHDGDQGGFSSELMIDPADKCASVLIVNTTDAGQSESTTHAVPNTEPDSQTDLRLALRLELMTHVYPACGAVHSSH